MDRRMVLVAAGSMLTAGCSDITAADESGVVDDSDGIVQNVDVTADEILSVEVENKNGVVTFVSIDNPSDNVVVDTEVQTKKTIEYDATETGVFTISITPDGKASYELFIDSYK